MAEKEYIEREAALRANCYFCSEHLKDDSPCGEKCADYMKFMEIPAADVRPVVRASWGYPTPYTAQCTNCGTLYWDFRNLRDFKMNFCPNCGAYMREGQT